MCPWVIGDMILVDFVCLLSIVLGQVRQVIGLVPWLFLGQTHFSYSLSFVLSVEVESGYLQFILINVCAYAFLILTSLWGYSWCKYV